MRRRIIAVAALLCLPLLCGANYYRELLTLPRATAPAQTKTWEFLFPFNDTLGQRGGWTDLGKYGIASTGSAVQVAISNTFPHTGWGNHLGGCFLANGGAAWLGPTNIPAPGTNDFFMEGWFYISSAQSATGANTVCFWGDCTNVVAIPNGNWPFLYAAKSPAAGGRMNVYGSTNGWAQNQGINKSFVPLDLTWMSNTWTHIRAGVCNRTVCLWTNGVRVPSTVTAVSGNFAYTNAQNTMMQVLTVGGGRNSAIGVYGVQDFGYYLYAPGVVGNSNNFAVPTEPRTGYETF
jgi:hypothetical protein